MKFGINTFTLRLASIAALVLLFAAGCASIEAPPGPGPTPTTGTLELAVTGLPQGVDAAVTVEGPNGFERTVTGSATLQDIEAGLYTLNAAPVATDEGLFEPVDSGRQIVVAANRTRSATIQYRLEADVETTGTLEIVISGLTADVEADVVVRGPGGFVESVTESGTLGNLVPGLYTVAANEVETAEHIYRPARAEQQVELAEGQDASVTVSYAQSTARGDVSVSISGLPSGTNADVRVVGADGEERTVTASGTVTGLPVGTVTVHANDVTVNGTLYAPVPRSQEVTVEANGTGSASVVYATANPNATLEVQNLTAMTVINGQMQLIPGLRHDWISFSVIRSYFQPYHEGMQWHDQSTLRIRNTGTEPMLIETLAFGGVYGWQYEIVDKPELPFAIAAGDHVDLVLQMNFYRNNPSLSHMQNYSKLCPMDNSRVRDRDCGEVRRGTLTIESNAGNARSKVIQLAGAAMWAPETLGWQTDEGWWPHHELSVPQLVDVFGWTIDVEEPISALARNRHGSEVRSQRWRVADSSQPVIVRQLAAYHGCCGRFEATGTRHPDGTSDWHQEDWFDFGSSATRFEHQRLWGQSIFPRLRMGGRGLNSEWQDDRFAERVYSASQLPSTFPIRSTRSQDTTDVDLENGQLGLRMWPVRDHDGVLLPNVWMAVQDNVPPQGECFVDQEDDGMNCDYNDNIYLITNITPVAPIDPVPTN